jgi:hypothetical protein
MTYFAERQKFNQWWIHLITIGVTLLLLYSAIDLAEEEARWTMFIPIMIGLIVIIGLVYTHLETEVTTEAIYVGFTPFGRKRIARADIEQAYVRSYSPLGEYGGWGFRTGRRGTAYNVSGDQGLQLVLRNGKQILIGTQRPEELRRVVDQWLLAN